MCPCEGKELCCQRTKVRIKVREISVRETLQHLTGMLFQEGLGPGIAIFEANIWKDRECNLHFCDYILPLDLIGILQKRRICA